MNILFIGDIVGRSGREAVAAHLPRLKEKLRPDIIIANAENAAAGFGVTQKLAREFFALGIHCLTTGNHVWDQKELLGQIHQEPHLLRPLNYPEGTPGRGETVITTAAGKKVLVANLMGRLFMEALDDPFASAQKLLATHRLGHSVDAIFIDFHAEASSEKMAFGHYLDGRVSAVVGTHTHIPTADAFILPGGTAYQTDAGMSGDYDSVIGMKKDVPVAKFTRKLPTERMTPAEGEATLCGAFITTDDRTGLASSIRPIRAGGRLAPTED
ncbi:MAG: TIGR00282 family metallophosphoesterase [Alphaproteobacteria bacterium]